MKCHSLLVEVSINLSVSLQRKAGGPRISLSGTADLKQHYESLGRQSHGVHGSLRRQEDQGWRRLGVKGLDSFFGEVQESFRRLGRLQLSTIF